MHRIDQNPIRFQDVNDLLEDHLQQRIADRSWLEPCLNENEEAFPYEIKGVKKNKGEAKGKATICSNYFYPDNQGTRHVHQLKQTSPQFIVNVPMGRAPSLTSKGLNPHRMLHKLKAQSFSTNASASSRMFKSRVSVVVGINQAASISSKVNRYFKKKIKKMPLFDSVGSVRVFGFLWQPEYEKVSDNTKISSAKKAFTLLKVLSPKIAKVVRKNLELPNGKLHPSLRSQIPYNLIRETILKSEFTSAFAEKMREKYPSAPIYLATLDPDFLNLRIGKGIFSKALNNISLDNPFSVIGTGYQADPNELPLIRYAVKIDMMVRTAILQHIPYGAYFPEPFFLVLVGKPNEEDHLSELSFIGDGNALESRRMIQIGKKKHVLDNNMHFIEKGIVTAAPDRWKTKKNKDHATLAPIDFKRKWALSALRGISQSHLHPKQWADNIYAALSIKCSPPTKATAPMMYIFSVYDPISRMYKPDRFSIRVFNNTMEGYHNPLSDDQVNLLNTSKMRLRFLGMEISEVTKVVNAAKASGLAIYHALQEWSSP